jgi:hypothetical protein
MKKIAVSFLCAFIVMICGCDKIMTDNVSIVKNGILDVDKSLTIGKAFENYKYFKKTEWKSLTTENGKRLVNVNAQIDLTKHPMFNQENPPTLKTSELRFQFGINQDKTIQFKWCGVAAEKTNGEKIEPQEVANLLQCTNTLKAIYDNSPSL